MITHLHRTMNTRTPNDMKNEIKIDGSTVHNGKTVDHVRGPRRSCALTGSDMSEAWTIISGLITGMRIDDPRYSAARDWLNKNRKHQIISQNAKD